jgi:hypothetical protein
MWSTSLGGAAASTNLVPMALQHNGLWNFHLACYEALVGLPEAARERVQLAILIDPCLKHMAQQNTRLGPLLRPIS